MKHTYELRRFNDDNSVTAILKLETEPKYAKERAKNYANRHPGLYSLQKIETIAMYFTEKEIDKNA
jgi:hypothetical protein